MTTNIVVLDCQKMFVEGLESYFKLNQKNLEVVAQACTAEDLHEAIQKHKTDLLIMELNIPDQDGMTFIEELREERPDIKILVLSSYTESKLVREAFKKGVFAYISKTSVFSELVYAIQEVMEGNVYVGEGLRISPSAKNAKHKKAAVIDKYEDVFSLKQKITKREQEILQLITQGKNNKEIGSELFISDQTVGVHRKNLMKKLGIKNTVALIKFAYENHLV